MWLVVVSGLKSEQRLVHVKHHSLAYEWGAHETSVSVAYLGVVHLQHHTHNCSAGGLGARTCGSDPHTQRPDVQRHNRQLGHDLHA